MQSVFYNTAVYGDKSAQTVSLVASFENLLLSTYTEILINYLHSESSLILIHLKQKFLQKLWHSCWLTQSATIVLCRNIPRKSWFESPVVRRRVADESCSSAQTDCNVLAIKWHLFVNLHQSVWQTVVWRQVTTQQETPHFFSIHPSSSAYVYQGRGLSQLS